MLFFSACGDTVQVDHLIVTPASATVGISQTQAFTVIGYDVNGRLIEVNATWTVEGSIGSINSNGLFTAGSSSGEGYVVATVNDVSKKAAVTITDKATLSGLISSASGSGIADVTITLSGEANYLTTSTASGNYTIANITAGSYTLEAHDTLVYVSSSIEVTLATGEAAAQNITMTNRLSVSNENIYSNPPFDYITVSGKVLNNGRTTAEGCAVTYTFYNDVGATVSTGTASLGNIPPKNETSFSLVPSPTITPSNYSSYTKTAACASY